MPLARASDAKGPLSVCGARGPGAAGAPGGGDGVSGGPGHGAEGLPRGKMNKGWLELESDPGEEGAGRAGRGLGRSGGPEKRPPDHHSLLLSPHPGLFTLLVEDFGKSLSKPPGPGCSGATPAPVHGRGQPFPTSFLP